MTCFVSVGRPIRPWSRRSDCRATSFSTCSGGAWRDRAAWTMRAFGERTRCSNHDMPNNRRLMIPRERGTRTNGDNMPSSCPIRTGRNEDAVRRWGMTDRQRYRTADPDLDQRLLDILADAGATTDVDQLFEILVSGVRLAGDGAERLDLKITNAALKEMREAFRVFAAY